VLFRGLVTTSRDVTDFFQGLSHMERFQKHKLQAKLYLSYVVATRILLKSYLLNNRTPSFSGSFTGVALSLRFI
jgi:hypothetical protein